MKSLFAHWDEVEQRISRAQTAALFLDFDGTLAGFESRPDEVRLNAEARRSLARLGQSPRFQVCVITGRRRSDIAGRVGVRGIHYLGLHGWDDGSGRVLGAGSADALDQVKQKAKDLFGAEPCVWLEDKGASLALHYRCGDFREQVEALVAPHAEFLRIAMARHVLEVIPRELADKGDAVRRKMAGVLKPALPVYVGDDWIDEPAFAALARGITVHVGRKRKTRALYWVAGVSEVHEMLERLAERFA